MTVDEIFSVLDAAGINLWLEGGRLRFRAPAGALTDEVRAAIAAHRSVIIARLQLGRRMSAPVAARCSACDCRDWVDAPSQDGWIRTRCGRCERFIGYRPTGFGPTSRRT